jgi:hypothetical protein
MLRQRPAWTRLALTACAGLSALGCASANGRFPLKPPLWRDADMRPFSAECRPDPDPPKDDPGHKVCTPEPYESPLIWDGADNLVFRPTARFFAVDPGEEAVNVNSVDEVPDSSWFVNRIGRRPLSAEELAVGPCEGTVLDPNGADGSWLIDQGKPNGANPGFRVKVPGAGKFMLKADVPEQPERATGATSIAARLYHAAGWWAPCDSVVYFRPSLLKLKPGLTFTDNSGDTKPFDQETLDKLLENAARRGKLVRMVASRWLPGRAIGPFKYEGRRSDDPNDIIDHEDRRDLRGARLLAAWLNHFDSREQNTMNTWMAVNEKDPDSSPGYIRHWYIDLGDCFGSEWDWVGISKRLGHSYYLDIPYLLEDYVTLGVIERPWDRARRSKDGDIFGFFSSRDFRADLWRGGYPNPAFGRMTERDGAWAARIIARFSEAHVRTAVAAGDFTEPRHRAFLLHHLRERQRLLLRRYLSRLSPLADVRADGNRLCAVDLARATGVFPEARFGYRAIGHYGEELEDRKALAVESRANAELCVALPHAFADGGPPDDHASRYLVVDLSNGHAEGVLRAHLYDLGPRRGFQLVGVERPSDASSPEL